MAVRLLYIEDDFIDKKNMEWVTNHFDDISLQIKASFTSAQSILEQEHFDLIISDQNVEQEQLIDYLHLFKNKEFYVLSNSVSIDDVIVEKAKGIIKKPLTIGEFRELLGTNEQEETDTPNLNYFKIIDNPEAKAEMLGIIERELQNANTEIPKLVAENKPEALKNLIHKLASKFSVLGMETTFKQVVALEKELKNGSMPAQKIDQLNNQIATALMFLTSEKE